MENKKNEPVANKELIEIINKYYESFDIEFVHVYGHNEKNNPDDPDSIANAKADKLATMASKKALNEIKGKFVKNASQSKTSRTNKKSYVVKKPGLSKTARPRANYQTTKIVKPMSKRKKNTGFYTNGFPKGDDFVIELVKGK